MNAIEELNAAPSEEASSALGPLFEGAPRFVGRLVAGRPYRSWAELWARAREIASLADPIPVGILYRNPGVPCYEELRSAGQQRSARYIKSGLEAEFDKFTIWPQGADDKVRPSA